MKSRLASVAVVCACVAGCANVREAKSPTPLTDAYVKKYMAERDAAAAVPSKPCHAGQVPFKLGVAAYTLCRFDIDGVLKILKQLDVHCFCHKPQYLPFDASPACIAAFKEKLRAAGVECLTTGPLYTRGKTLADKERELRSQFQFAKNYGMKVVVGVPCELNPKIANIDDDEGRHGVCPPEEWNLESDAVLDIIDKLVKEYDICYAIHNHGPDNKYLFPTAESALKRVGGRDKRIGVCLDVGHEMRGGCDPAAFIRAHGDRIYDVHMKNVRLDARYNVPKEGPRGELDIPAIMQALSDVGYSGGVHIEYEKDFENPTVPLAESVGYYRGCMDSVRKTSRAK